MQFKIEGLETIASNDARVTVHKLSNGSTLPLTLPPLQGDQIPGESYELAQGVRKAGNAIAVFDNTRRAAANDRGLSEEGRAQKIAPTLKALREAIEEAEARAAQLDAAASAMRDQAFAVPELETADVNGALIDQEIRAHARSLKDKALTDYMAQLNSNPRHIEAVKRSPVPIALLSDQADRLWRESRRDTPMAKKAAILAESADWARDNLYSIKRIIRG